MTDQTFRSVVVLLLSAAVFCLAVLAAPSAVFAAEWMVLILQALPVAAAIGMAAGVVLFLLAAGAGRRLE